MQRLYYAGAEFLMSDAAAQALLDFAALIAGAGKSQRIAVPVISELGEPSVIQAIVGPASQIVSMHAPSDVPDPDSAEFLQDLGRRSSEYQTTTAIVGHNETPGWDELE